MPGRREAVRGGGAACGVMESQETLPTAARRAGGGIVQQIGFRREALKNRHGHARSTLWRGISVRYFPSRLEVFAVVFEDEFR